MNLKINTLNEGMDFINNVVKQGDFRYNHEEEEVLLADFLLKDAIRVKKKYIPHIKELHDMAIKMDKGEIQGVYKAIAKLLLQKEGFQENEICFERPFRGFKPDVLAKSPNKQIIVECCSCYVSKIIDFLREIDEVWILTRGYSAVKNKEILHVLSELFIFKKSSNWDKYISSYDDFHLKRLQKVKSPL